MLLLRRGLLRKVSPSARKPAYLRGCFRCSFLFFFPPAFSFSFPSLNFFTGLPRLPNSPLPSRSSFLQLLDLGAPREGQHTTHVQNSGTHTRHNTATQLSDPNCIGCVKTGLRFFSLHLQTIAWGHFGRHDLAISRMPFKSLLFEKPRHFFDPLCIGLAKTRLLLFSR